MKIIVEKRYWKMQAKFQEKLNIEKIVNLIYNSDLWEIGMNNQQKLFIITNNSKLYGVQMINSLENQMHENKYVT